MKTTRYKVTLQYDGTHFAGFQIQPKCRTVQGEIEKSLKTMTKGTVIKIQASGRTDAGVHALGQVIHFDYPSEIPPANMLRALNSLTTDEIAFIEAEIVDDQFHARYFTNGKRYQYRVNISKVADPFLRDYTLHHPYPIHMEYLEAALKDIVGTHDFTSFCAVKSGRENKVRTIYEATVTKDETRDELIFEFYGNGFLYNMVRILIGTLMQIANGRRPVTDMKRIIEAKDRQQAGPTALPHGLYLKKVYYLNAAEIAEKIAEKEAWDRQKELSENGD
ncbi:tRNA pseudouridine(38-40) synthase TruA [Carnobacterium divergens]|uniref:tRNA pseudouridine(38-40) synthase TruA n=1 Tax=Carnobacterium divergens TaxID=2748 RepID=UPI0007F47071|nr:tRNA pseudouridine(38-40) synthase TruA [Carnobacterium divergens]SBO17112.1 pseudouridylate synthase I [Carnobacterium divergens]